MLRDVHCNTSDYLVLLQCTYNVTSNNICSQNVNLVCCKYDILVDAAHNVYKLY